MSVYRTVWLDKISVGRGMREFPVDTASLENSMSQVGQLAPVVLNTDLELVCGYSRFLAASRAGKETIEAVVLDFDSPLEELQAQHDENERRTPLHWSEACRRRALLHMLYSLESLPGTAQFSYEWGDVLGAYQELRSQITWREEDTAAKLGVSQKTISQSMRVALMLELEPDLVSCSSEKEALGQGRSGINDEPDVAITKALNTIVGKFGVENVNRIWCRIFKGSCFTG